MSQRVDDYNQPIGEAVVNWERRAFPTDMRYVGKYTIITNLTQHHIKDLYEAFLSTDPRRNWTYLLEDCPKHYAEFEQMLLEKIESPEKVCYVVIDKQTNQPVGAITLKGIDQDNGVIEISNINFTDRLKRTRMSTEAHYLLASYVFDELKYRRYVCKCDALHENFIRTAKRLGFTHEGIFRKAMIYKNRLRDIYCFSMLEEEWPLHKEAITKWLSEDNFDEHGQQINKLESFR